MDFLLEIIVTIIYGVVEGITEWLPVSSTGHLIIIQDFVQGIARGSLAKEDFMEMFNVVIQLGAILAVVWIYFNKLNPFDKKKTEKERNKTIRLWVKVIIATIPAAIFGLLFDDFMDKYFFNVYVVAIALIFYGVVFIFIEDRNKNAQFKYKSLDKLPLKTAIGIGLFQILSLIPGTSRSGSTIIGGLLLGTSRPVATEFTFFLAIPVMFGASLLKIVKFIGTAGFTSFSEIFILLLGMFVSFIVSVLAIKFLVSYVSKHDFKIFGKYRIVLGGILIIYALAKLIFSLIFG
ncbi:MAG: undecaprenyl-diphosphate phosphatase [Lachnospirales bacterium]